VLRLNKLLLALPFALLMAAAGMAQKTDYLTESEADLVRDAQGIELRVRALLKLADNRIVALGLRELSAKEREEIRKDIERYESEAKAVKKIEGAELRARPVNPAVYLRNYARSDLLRGFMQVLDETMDNIDDAYIRKLEVRPAVEELEAFVALQIPRFKKFSPSSPLETSLIQTVIEHSELVLADVQDALKTLPKTERRPSKP
jgi:hypothetical protein